MAERPEAALKRAGTGSHRRTVGKRLRRSCCTAGTGLGCGWPRVLVMDFATNRRLGDLSATGALRCPSRWWRRGGRRGVPLVGAALAMLTMGAGSAFSASDPQPVHRVADGGIFD